MNRFQFFIPLIFLFFFISCNSSDKTTTLDVAQAIGKGALITTRFESFEEFKKVVQIEYSKDRKSWVRLTQTINDEKITSILKSGISEKDIVHARDGSFWDKAWLGLRSPYFVSNRKDLQRIFILSRRKQLVFGEGDISFYDLAEAMLQNISEEDLARVNAADLSEKGFINTFNHINAQAIMTTIFSEKLADFVADLHERRNMPELITGKFSEAQITNIENGPVDNYVDMINNEWGQELGKQLKERYKINQTTYWTSELLANFLNDLQKYYSWVFQISFKPFKPTDQLVTRFLLKINTIMKSVSEVE